MLYVSLDRWSHDYAGSSNGEDTTKVDYSHDLEQLTGLGQAALLPGHYQAGTVLTVSSERGRLFH